jgi:hypothetical protein
MWVELASDVAFLLFGFQMQIHSIKPQNGSTMSGRKEEAM